MTDSSSAIHVSWQARVLAAAVVLAVSVGGCTSDEALLDQLDGGPATKVRFGYEVTSAGLADYPAAVDVLVYTYTEDDSPLPEGSYTWTFDEYEDAGPVGTHAQRQMTFFRGGAHRVALTITAAGMSYAIGCETPGQREVQVYVEPTVQGRIADQDGAPVAGATVRAHERQARTDGDGWYSLVVPYDWTGDVVAESDDWSDRREVVHIKGDRDDLDFVRASGQLPDPPTDDPQSPAPEDPPVPGDPDPEPPADDPQPELIAEDASVMLQPGQAQVVTLEGRAGANDPFEYIITDLPAGVIVIDEGNDREVVAGDLPYRLVNGGARVRCVADVDFASGALRFKVTDGRETSEAATVSLGVPQGSAVQGTVTGLDGEPLQGVVIQLEGTGPYAGQNLETSTGPDGRYEQELPSDWQGTLSPKDLADASPAEVVVGREGLPTSVDFTKRRTIIVAKNGKSGAAGTLADPLGSIQEALDRAVPGNTIYIREGEYTEPILTFARSGLPNAPITVASYPDERATITSGSRSKPVFDFTQRWNGGHQEGFGHLVFDGLRMHGSRHAWMIELSYDGGPLEQEQAKAIHDVVIRNCEIWDCESALKARNAGIRNLFVSDTHVHDCIGDQAGWDFGEWPDGSTAIRVPRSASRNLEFVRCDSYENRVNQQSCGWVFQPCVSNVTMRQCRAWNNGKYGFACKGSGSFRLDRCAAWGNSSTQMYCRGMGTADDGTPRPPTINDFLLTNCVFIAPADQRGGSALNIRENVDVTAYNCTVVGLRDGTYNETGGYALLQGHHHEVPCKLELHNSMIVGFDDATAVRMYDSGPPSSSYMAFTRFVADNNLYYAAANTSFKYQANNWTSFSQWQQYWANGEPGGNDQEMGPTATNADAHSLFAQPGFRDLAPGACPLVHQASSNFLADRLDVRPAPGSPAIGAGKNFGFTQIPELMYDYAGNPRPKDGPWTIGAFVAPSE